MMILVRILTANINLPHWDWNRERHQSYEKMGKELNAGIKLTVWLVTWNRVPKGASYQISWLQLPKKIGIKSSNVLSIQIWQKFFQIP